MTPPDFLQPWKSLGSQPLGDFKIFTIRSDRKVSPRTLAEHEVYVIDCVNWVNVVAVTADEHLVMVQQYRHGSNTIELEIPGGMMDATDGSPEATAIRELREETGYAGTSAVIIGEVFPNPAIMSNTCYTVFIQDCRQLHEIELDSGEDMLTTLVPLAEVPGLVAQGKIRHSLVVAGLYYYDLWKRRKLP